MILMYEELGLLLPNDSKFLITVTNYSLIVDYELSESVNSNVAKSTLSPSAPTSGIIETIGIHTIIIAIIAAAAVLFIAGHVLLTCRKRSRRQTWSVQSAANTARGRFIQRDIWTGTRRPESSEQSAGNDPFHTDIYRTLAYAYINWKQDMTSIPGSCRSFSSASGSSDKPVNDLNGHVTESNTSCSSRTADDVTLPSSLTGEISMTSSTSWRQQTSSSSRLDSDVTCRSDITAALTEITFRKDPNQASYCGSTVKFANFDGDYEARIPSVLGCEAVVDLDSSTGAPSDDGHSDVTMTSFSSGLYCSPTDLHISMNDELTDVVV